MDAITLAAAKKFTKDTAIGLGAVMGKNCTVKDIAHDTVNRKATVTFEWTADNGTKKTRTAEIPYGTDGTDGHTPTDQELTALIEQYFIDNPIETNYTNMRGVAQNIGGIKAGEKFNDVPIQTVLDKLFAPPYTKPSVAVTTDCALLNDPDKISVSSIRVTAAITKGTEEIKSVKFYINGNLESTVNSPASLSVPFTYNAGTEIKSNVAIRVEVEDAETHSVVSASKTVEFYPGCHYGTIEDGVAITEATVGTLPYKLKNGKADTFTFSANFGRFVFAYPKIFGAVSSAKDLVNNFNYSTSISTQEMTINGHEFYVVYLTDAAGFDNLSVTFA